MTFALAFWILMLIWFVFGVVWPFAWPATAGAYHPIVNGLLLFILFLLLGWKVFGAPLHG